MTRQPLPPGAVAPTDALDDATLDGIALSGAVDAAGFDPTDERLPDRARAWSVTDVGSAEWAMRKLAEVRARVAAANVQADTWIDQIAEWNRAVTAADQASSRFFEYHLERYALDRREDDGTKTVKLPSGQIATRAGQPAQAVVDDPDVVLVWAASSLTPDDVEAIAPPVPPKLLLAELRKRVAVVVCPICDGTGGVYLSLGVPLEAYVECDRCRGEGASVVSTKTGEWVPGVSVKAPGEPTVRIDVK